MSIFIVTVDTEGDNLWCWKEGEKILTNNTKSIVRFQELCEKYKIKPVYFINYEMAMDDRLIKYLKPKNEMGKCEIGMHCHAWNTPPEYYLDNKYGGNPYITEYPEEIMYQKMKFMTELLEKTFEDKIISHRAGRWASNKKMFEILKKLGYRIDCSYVAEMDMSSIKGATIKSGFNYKKIKNKIYKLEGNFYEIPMTTMKIHHFTGKSLKKRLKNFILGEQVWMRTAVATPDLMKKIIDQYQKKGEYIEFMIHSSELMIGGSPYFKTEKDIERHFNDLEEIFKYASQKCSISTFKEFIGD